jgi:type VI protein secretion system component Hcp
MNRLASLFASVLLVTSQVCLGAVNAYLDIPAIPGPGSPQKYPTSILLLSFAWATKANDFTVKTYDDFYSPSLFARSVDGHALLDVNVLFYKALNEEHDPYLTFNFPSVIVSSYSVSVGGPRPIDNVTFNYGERKAVYLVLPTAPGVDAPPLYPGSRLLDSFTFDSNGLTISKPQDASSPALANAAAQQTDLGPAYLAFYDLPVGATTPVDPPTDVMVLSDLTPSSYQTFDSGNGGALSEQVTFQYSDFSELPEPGTLVLLAAGAAVLLHRRKP